MSEDFYDVLGVDRDASPEEVRKAFRRKAAEYHPDVSDDPDAEEKFKRIQRAKDVLTDEEKRRAYDRLGHDRFERARKQGGFDGGPGGAGGFGGDPFGSGGSFGDFGDLGGFGDIFEQFFGGRGGRGGSSRRRRRGADLRTRLTIDLEDAFEGATKRVTFRRPDRCGECGGRGYPPDEEPRTCPECGGSGQVTHVGQTPFGRVQQTATCRRCDGEGRLHERMCPACGGDGTVTREKSLSVEVPAGIRDGQTLRMEGEGAAARDAPSGDLLIEVSVREHDLFERDGDNIHYRMPVSFPGATFGTTVEVPTLSGSVEMDISPGTQSGETLRLRGRGMPHLRGSGRGDQYVHVQVVTPEPGDLNEEQRRALEAYAEAGGEDIQVGRSFFERIKGSFES